MRILRFNVSPRSLPVSRTASFKLMTRRETGSLRDSDSNCLVNCPARRDAFIMTSA